MSELEVDTIENFYIRVNYDELLEKTIKVFEKRNINYNVSKKIANCMVMADACGIHTHGLAVLESHIKRVERNAYNIDEEPKIIKEALSFAVVDANNTIGLYSAQYCMDLAISRCKENGIFIVFSKNSNTFGPAFYYPYLAVKNKLIGICFSNSPANMPATGGKEKILGTNPLSIGIPGNQEGPILFDMATSIIAKSKIKEMAIAGKKLPLGVALDEMGNPTIDSNEALKGMVLPIAGHKGYGLALCLDILSGVISGASYSNKVGRFYSEENNSMNIGQTFIVIDPKKIGTENFYDKIDDYIRILHNSKKNNDATVYYPGEKEMNLYKYSIDFGVKIDKQILQKINELGRERK
ncbi:Ldh family oxidoreductase [uncultured Thomasclavelia sp.]|uniref:Ldh family oxidoreductase n=1 Tax=uncultured Thomasclavelia sp. TaxID=3025759 RepID=UPI00263193BF|nr:Ldh family oxidoreductase [uncultured Thomasclavelia sp.]